MTFIYASNRDSSRVVRWTCDGRGCRNAEDVADSGDRLVSLKPAEWYGLLLTSMTDGDQGYVLCPDCSDRLFNSLSPDADVFANLQAVGY